MVQSTSWNSTCLNCLSKCDTVGSEVFMFLTFFTWKQKHMNSDVLLPSTAFTYMYISTIHTYTHRTHIHIYTFTNTLVTLSSAKVIFTWCILPQYQSIQFDLLDSHSRCLFIMVTETKKTILWQIRQILWQKR